MNSSLLFLHITFAAVILFASCRRTPAQGSRDGLSDREYGEVFDLPSEVIDATKIEIVSRTKWPDFKIHGQKSSDNAWKVYVSRNPPQLGAHCIILFDHNLRLVRYFPGK